MPSPVPLTPSVDQRGEPASPHSSLYRPSTGSAERGGVHPSLLLDPWQPAILSCLFHLFLRALFLWFEFFLLVLLRQGPTLHPRLLSNLQWYVHPAGLKLTAVLLLQPHHGWNYRHALCLASSKYTSTATSPES